VHRVLQVIPTEKALRAHEQTEACREGQEGSSAQPVSEAGERSVFV
jgi:hypothetical protein